MRRRGDSPVLPSHLQWWWGWAIAGPHLKRRSLEHFHRVARDRFRWYDPKVHRPLLNRRLCWHDKTTGKLQLTHFGEAYAASLGYVLPIDTAERGEALCVFAIAKGCRSGADIARLYYGCADSSLYLALARTVEAGWIRREGRRHTLDPTAFEESKLYAGPIYYKTRWLKHMLGDTDETRGSTDDIDEGVLGECDDVSEEDLVEC